jgi:dethiobiotin synthetase
MSLDPSPLHGYFISGSDTGVGKTWVACQLIERWRKQGKNIRVRKPVESGCERDPAGNLLPADGLALARAAGNIDALDSVTPYRFEAALAPDRAAMLAHASLTIQDLAQAVRAGLTDDDFVIVEGAGGICSPLTRDGLNADLARCLQLPLILVVEDRLGAINQALMAIRAADAESLRVAAVILNHRSEISEPHMDNLADLGARLQIPVYRCPLAAEMPETPL